MEIPEMAVNRKYTIPNAFCTLWGTPKIVPLRSHWPLKVICLHDFPDLQLLKLRFPPRAGSKFVKKCILFLKDSVYSHQSIQKKAQVIKQLQKCKCDECSRWALEVKIAEVTSDNQTSFDGRLNRKKDEPNGTKWDKCQKDGPMNPY